MPVRNRVKIFLENAVYHVYNRGVEKRVIFLDNQDFRVFLSFIKVYLCPPQSTLLVHPITQVTGSDPVKIAEYAYSSYAYYLGKKKAEWLNPLPVLDLFRKTESYQSFVEDYPADSRAELGKLAID